MTRKHESDRAIAQSVEPVTHAGRKRDASDKLAESFRRDRYGRHCAIGDGAKLTHDLAHKLLAAMAR